MNKQKRPERMGWVAVTPRGRILDFSFRKHDARGLFSVVEAANWETTRTGKKHHVMRAIVTVAP